MFSVAKPFMRLGAASLGALILATASFASAAGDNARLSSERYRVRARQVTEGLTLLRILDRRGPNQIRVLEVDPATDLTLDVELANDRIPGHERTSSMAARNDAVAAINGDYTLLPSDFFAGRPVHMFAEDGRAITTPLLYGRNFSISRDEQAVFIAHPKDRFSARQHDSGETWSILAWNEIPEAGQFGVYTLEGGQTYPPPRRSCSVRLYPTQPLTWSPDRLFVEQSYVVNAVKCDSTRLRRKGGVILAAPLGSKQALMIQQQIVLGEGMTLGWSTGWPGVLDTIGGNPTLLENGVITAEDCNDSYFCKRNPRSAVGVTGDGRILLVTVDGRQKDWSVGLRLVPLAKLMQRLGAVSALNLDGGGSTTMWLQGKIKNRVSDGQERAVGSSILVLPGADVEEPDPAASPAPSDPGDLSVRHIPARTGSTSPTDPCATLRDPASTGGLFDHIAKERAAAGKAVPRAVRRALPVYRGDLNCADYLTR